jgi:N-acyl-D-amino-acid deacylase
MAYDLLVHGGTVVDGSGLPGYRADVGIQNGKIAAIGDLKGQATKEKIDAEGHVVSPGFIDGHTHFDAQVFWDHVGSNVCWSGVTTAIMGNCSYTLAPCAEKDKRLVFSNFERAEEIPAEAMETGIPWSWTTIPEHLDTLDKLPKGLNYGIHVGHSALRTYVMGQKAFTDEANADQLETMVKLVKEGMKAGCLGFSTARSVSHRTAEGNPVASRVAAWSEIETMVETIADLGSGIFQVSRGFGSSDVEERKVEQNAIRDLAVRTKVPTTCGSTWYRRKQPNQWREQFAMLDEVNAKGGRMMVQGAPSWSGSMRSFQTVTPFDKHPVWSDFRKLPLAKQAEGLRDPEMRKKLVDVAQHVAYSNDPKLPNWLRHPTDWDWIFPHTNFPPHHSMAKIAREKGMDPVELFIDMSLESELTCFFDMPAFNESEEYNLALVRHPHCGVTFSDAGAHVSSAINPVQSYYLGWWVREQQAVPLETAVRKMTYELATFWDLPNRGLLKEGYCADVTIFDPKTVAPGDPQMAADLPMGGKRLIYKSDGFLATIVNGKVFMRNNEHTGAFNGQLMRGRLAQK